MAKKSPQAKADRAEVERFWKAAGLKPAPYAEMKATILAFAQGRNTKDVLH